MPTKHIIPGLDDPTCGIAVAAKQLMARGVGEDGEVWVHSMWTPFVIKSSIKALMAGKRLVRMPHGCTDPTKLKHHWHKKRWVAPIERWLFRRADRIIATCDDEVEWIKAFEPMVKKVELIQLSAPITHLSAIATADPSAPISHPSSLNLIFIGRLHPLKGVEFLVEALHAVQDISEPMRSLRLKIIGKDEGEGPKLRRMATDYKLDVEFCGIVSEDAKNAAYDWCDALVLPTLSENFGLVIAEALERGKRVITTDGAPAWAPSASATGDKGDGNMYGGRLTYLKGYRDGSRDERVQLLASAIRGLAKSE